MLDLLKIENFAIIKKSEINFSDNLNVISGETGSGKSIIMKAIKFVLGSRSDKTIIRDGSNSTKVQASFFNYDKFYYMLNSFEKSLLDKPKFPNMVDLYQGSRNHFHVDDDGTINDADDVWVMRKKTGDVMSCGVFFNGKNLKDVERINCDEELGLNIDNVNCI